MCRIQIAISVDGVLGSPARLAVPPVAKLYTASVWFFATVKFDMPQIVLIAAFEVNHLSKKILAHHKIGRAHV